MTALSVNINKIATLRNARGGNEPNILVATKRIESFGADGITVHPRPDGRHIRYEDVREIAEIVSVEFNIEGYPSSEFIDLVLEVKPTQVTLVPDPPNVLTSNEGWDVLRHTQFLQTIISRFKDSGIRTSIFMETSVEQLSRVVQTGVDRVELYTGPYAQQFSQHPEQAIAPFVEASKIVLDQGVKLNAGHDLNLDNLPFFCQHISGLSEVSIGHALISEALYLGLEETIKRYKKIVLSRT